MKKDQDAKNLVDKKLQDKMNIHFMSDDIYEGMDSNGVSEFTD